MSFPRTLFVALLLTAIAPAAAEAEAELVVPDTGVRNLYALEDTIVYRRAFGRNSRESRTRPWMRVVDGRRLRARGVPRGAFGSAIGLDHRGRVVLMLKITRIRRHRVRDIDWWVYDVRRDRARRIRTLPSGRCAPSDVSLWRGRLAYVNQCSPRVGGVYVRHRGRTRRLASSDVRTDIVGWWNPVLRGGTLVAEGVNGDGYPTLWRLMDRGRVCRTRIPGAALDHDFFEGAWLSGRTLLWSVVGDEDGPPWHGLVGTELGGTCERPGPTGYVPASDGPTRRLPGVNVAVDGVSVYYAERDGVHRATRERRPVTGPPPNDAFADAASLPSSVPSSTTMTLGNATREPGEPALRYEPTYGSRPAVGTAWYAFRPAASQTVTASTFFLGLGVYTGATLQTLQAVSTKPGYPGIMFDAQAGETYWIAAGCSDFLCYLRYPLEIRAAGS